MADKAKIGVLGASGYTGAELLRLLLPHPRVEIALLTDRLTPSLGGYVALILLVVDHANLQTANAQPFTTADVITWECGV